VNKSNKSKSKSKSNSMLASPKSSPARTCLHSFMLSRKVAWFVLELASKRKT